MLETVASVTIAVLVTAQVVSFVVVAENTVVCLLMPVAQP